MTTTTTTPRTIRPMLAETAPEPFDSDAHSFEVKWDGFRAILFWTDGKIRLQSRNLRDLTPRFPEFGRAASGRTGDDRRAERRPIGIAARDAVLDGELVLIRGGRPDFHGLLARGGGAEVAGNRRTDGNRPGTVTYVAFDLLYLEGDSLLEAPYTSRRERLAAILRADSAGADGRVALCPAVPGQGMALYKAALEQGLEGVVAKRADSRYFPGKRSPHWLKVRHTRSIDAVIGGFAVRDGRLSSLALGLYLEPGDARTDDRAAAWTDGNGGSGRLLPLGHVGTGFSDAERSALLRALDRLRTEHSPFASRAGGAVHRSPFASRRPSETFWVRPILVCRVEALETTSDGKLRHPVFRGLRSDKEPEACTSAQM